MINFRLLIATITAAVSSIIPTGVSRAVGQLDSLIANLDAAADRADDRLFREFNLQDASYERQRAVARTEAARREASATRADALLAEGVRARRVRDRIAGLLD